MQFKSKKQGKFKEIWKRAALMTLVMSMGMSAVISGSADMVPNADRPLKVLAIGNSFTVDATRDLYGIAQADNFDLELTVLYQGSSSLQTHWTKFQDGESYTAYNYGQTDAPKTISLEDSLRRKDWDVVILQQVSSSSTKYSTYQPYLADLTNAIKEISPDVEFVIHQTWSCYKGDSRISGGSFGTQESMFEDLQNAYRQAAESLGENTRIIPSGAAWQKARSILGDVLNRDLSSHANARGGYLAAAVWYEVLSGNSILDNSYSKPVITSGSTDNDELICKEVNPIELELLKQCAHEAVQEHDYLEGYTTQPDKSTFLPIDQKPVKEELPTAGGPWYFDGLRENAEGVINYVPSTINMKDWGEGGGIHPSYGSATALSIFYFLPGEKRVYAKVQDRIADPAGTVISGYRFGVSFRFEAPAAGEYSLDLKDLNFNANSKGVPGKGRVRVMKGGTANTPGTEVLWPKDGSDWMEVEMKAAGNVSGWISPAPLESIPVTLEKNEIVRIEACFVADSSFNDEIDFLGSEITVHFARANSGGHPAMNYLGNTVPSSVYNTINKIAEIGTVTLNSGEKINGAKALYTALSADEKLLVTNSGVIEKAESALAKIEQINDDFNYLKIALGNRLAKLLLKKEIVSGDLDIDKYDDFNRDNAIDIRDLLSLKERYSQF